MVILQLTTRWEVAPIIFVPKDVVSITKNTMNNFKHKQLKRTTLRTIIFSIVLFSVSTFIVNCGQGGGNTSTADTIPVTATQFNASVQTAANFDEDTKLTDTLPDPVPTGDAEVETITKQEEHYNEMGDTTPVAVEQSYECTIQQYEAMAGYDRLFLLNPSTAVIYPGSILDGDSIATGAYTLLSGGKRKPLNVSISISGYENPSREVESPALSSIRTALGQMLSDINAADDSLMPAANSVFTTETVHSSTSFGLALGVNINAQVSPTFQVGLGFSFDFSKENSEDEVVARFAQVYYSADIDIPAQPSDFYEEFPDLSGVSSPVYVSSVNYGRMVLFNLKSLHSELSIQTALNASLNIQDKLTIEANLDAHYRNVISNSTVNSTVIGGAGEVCNGVNNLDSLGDCIENGGSNYNDAMPMSYVLRHLSDNTVAQVLLSTSYVARQCTPTGSTVVPQWVTKNIELAEIGTAEQDGFDKNEEETYGRIWIFRTNDDEGAISSNCIPNFNPSFNHLATHLIFDRDSDQTIKTGKSPKDVTGLGFQESVEYRTVPNPHNIKVCTYLRDEDSNSSNETIVYNRGIVISPDAIKGDVNSSTEFTISGEDGNHLKFKLISN